jgi:hypothetical protein
MWRQATLAGQVRGKGRDRLSQCGRSRRHWIGPPNLAYLGLTVRALAERRRLRGRDAVWGPSHSHKAHADLPGGRGQAPWPSRPVVSVQCLPAPATCFDQERGRWLSGCADATPAAADPLDKPLGE